MRQSFFYEGTQIATPVGHYLLAQNKLDSHHYALERVENCSVDYVYDFYSCIDNNNFIKYYTCWDEEEIVVKKVEKQDPVETKGTKKKSSNLASFLSKKKAEFSSDSSTKAEMITKSKKQMEPKKQETTKVKVVYIQLEAFQPATIPSTIEETKSMLALIYILAESVHQSQDLWPNFIPAIGSDGTYRFIKKGGSRDQQLIKLFQWAMKDRMAQQWSIQTAAAYQTYKINGETVALVSQIHQELWEICNKQYEIKVKDDGKIKTTVAKIVEPGVLLLAEQKRNLHISEYNVTVSYNGENTKEITLEHFLDDEIVVIGEFSNFIIRYLKTFRGK